MNNDNVHGYEIKQSIVFENNQGVALGINFNAPQPFVTWQFFEQENGQRDYEWGHYFTDSEKVKRDFNNRVYDYQTANGVAEKGSYKYYSTQRPVDIGTYPKTENGPVKIINFDKRTIFEDENCRAWGFLEYKNPLTEKQIDDYELRAAKNNPTKSIAQQMKDATAQAAKDNADRHTPPKNTDKGR